MRSQSKHLRRAAGEIWATVIALGLAGPFASTTGTCSEQHAGLARKHEEHNVGAEAFRNAELVFHFRFSDAPGNRKLNHHRGQGLFHTECGAEQPEDGAQQCNITATW